jgi:hypothetical protein
MKSALLFSVPPLLLAGQTPVPPATLEGRVIDALPVSPSQARCFASV